MRKIYTCREDVMRIALVNNNSSGCIRKVIILNIPRSEPNDWYSSTIFTCGWLHEIERICELLNFHCNNVLGVSLVIILIWFPVMTWCRQAICIYLIHCWQRSNTSCDVNKSRHVISRPDIEMKQIILYNFFTKCITSNANAYSQYEYSLHVKHSKFKWW